ncbi:MAG: biotin/lipoyl-binding protein [Chloroflexi bacterium]|nr:biotin/lipoyl-binding protein [Chloroflexota bacterium]
MADIALGYDDLLDTPRHPLRKRLLLLAGALVIVGLVAWFSWDRWGRGGSAATAPQFTAGQSVTGNIAKTISTSGTVSAQKTSNLGFTTSGKVVGVYVTLGQAVKQGDALAQLDSTDAVNALRTAQATLSTQRAKLATLLAGGTASQLAAADQSLLQAQAAYDKAVQAQIDLTAPPLPTDMEAAQQGVTSAQAQLTTAQEARQTLDSTAVAGVAKAQAALSTADDGVSQAQQGVDDAQASLTAAEAALASAETAYCPDPDVGFCGGAELPLSSSSVSALSTAAAGSDAVKAKAASSVLQANTGYRSASSGIQKADAALTAAERTQASARDALSSARSQPTTAQVATADAAISGAQSDLDAANKKLSDLQAGPTQQALAAAQSAIDQAGAALASAQAKRNETYAGAVSADIQAQQASVTQAEISVENAQKNLDNTKLVAPFDGTVAALNVNVGDTSGGGSSSGAASSAAIVLNTPSLVTLNLTVSETDYPSVKVGNGGVATFEALPNQTFAFVIDSLGVNPTTTQGVVTYQAKARLVTGPAALPILQSLRTGAAETGEGAPAGGGRAAAATRQAGAAPGTPAAGATQGTPVAGAAPNSDGFPGGLTDQAAATGKPVPGMNATVTIVVDSRTNVVIVPARAVQTRGRTSFVTVKQADGSTQDTTVTTGLADATNIQITSGIDAGASILIPGAATTTAASQALPATGGRTGGGGGFGGDGGGAGHGPGGG